MSDDVRLIIDGQSYAGWNSVSIRTSLDEVISSFELGIVDAWNGSGLPRVRNGAPCQVWLDDTVLVTGYLDRIQRRYDDAQRAISVSGRAKAADLQDCSYPLSTLPASWKSQTVLHIANALAKPFGIAVTDSSGLASHVVEIAKVQNGDTPLDILAAYMRVIGARLVSLPDGNLDIVTASTDRLGTGLRLGDNILRAEDTDDLRDRFSDYRVVSQTKGSDKIFADATASVVGKSHDPVMAAVRYRPTIINSEVSMASIAAATRRADVARNNAAGRSHMTTYDVHGWRHADGRWAFNHQVHVTDAECGWEDWLIIGTVELVLDDKGRRSRITVMPATAYDAVPIPAKQTGDVF